MVRVGRTALHVAAARTHISQHAGDLLGRWVYVIGIRAGRVRPTCVPGVAVR